MGKYDGAIRIATKITTKDAEESLASLEWQIKKSAKYMDELRSKMDTLKGQEIPTKEYKDLQSDLEDAEKRLSDLIAEQEKYNELGLTSGGAWDILNEKVASASDKVDLIKEKMQTLSDEGKAFNLGENTAEYRGYERQLEYEEEAVKKAQEHYQQLLLQTPEMQKQAAEEERLAQIKEHAVVGNQKIVQSLERIKQLEQEIADLKKVDVSEGYTDYDNKVRELADLKQQVKDYQQTLLQTPDQLEEAQHITQIQERAAVGNQRIIQTVERIKQLEQEITDLKTANRTEGYTDYDNRVRELSSLKRQVRDYNANITQTQKSYSRLGQVAKKSFSVVYSLISRVNKSAKKTGGLFSNITSRFKGLALSLLIFNQISKAFNSMISGMKEGFKNLYNEVDSFKSAIDSMKASSLTLKNSFAAAFRPLVEIAIPYIQKTIDALANFMDTVGQLTAAITGQKTYTKAIKQTTAAIKDQNKAQSRQLSSLDKLNNLTSNKGTDTDSSAGSGTMFEEQVLIPQKSLDTSEWIKNMWNKSDFTELGESFGENVKNSLDNINWDEIKEKGQKTAKSLATLINGFVQTEGLPESIGETIGNAINTGVSTAKTFFEETEFDELGKSVAKTANTAMETTDWKEMAETVSLGIESALDMAIGFLDEFDWEEFTKSIEEFITGMDWAGIFGRLGLLLLELLRGAFTIGNTLGADMTKSLADFFRGIGWDSVAGFFDGLSEKIKKQGERVKLMFQVVIDWVKEKLGIHSPSTVFSDIGQNIVKGLMNGLDGLKEKVLNIFNSVKNAVKTPINMILGLVESLANGIIKAINFAIGALNNLSITVPDWLKYIPGLSDIAGKTFGFNIPELNQVSIPRLATGTVVPPNREFLAVLGDNKREPEVVSPLSTIEQAVENVLRRSGGAGSDKEINLHLTVECEGYQLIHVLQKLNKEYAKQNSGKSIFA